MNPLWESRYGSLIAAAGSIWMVYEATSHLTNFTLIVLRPGPLELCALGIVAWLHAKYRAALDSRATLTAIHE